MTSTPYNIYADPHPSDLGLTYDERPGVFGSNYDPAKIVVLPKVQVLIYSPMTQVLIDNTYPKENMFIKAIFSTANILAIQKGIIRTVKSQAGYDIGEQSNEELIRILQNVLENGYDATTVSNPTNMKDEILRIDTTVVAQCVPLIIANIGLYQQNLKDIDRTAPIDELALPQMSFTHNEKGSELPGYINLFW
jgi:hypothetical protein